MHALAGKSDNAGTWAAQWQA